MESWRTVWRESFAKLIPVAGLEALLQALKADDPRLIQGAPTNPPPLMCVQDWPVEGGCALSFAGWQGENLENVGQTEEFFARMCFEADKLLGEAGGMRHFLSWFDDTPRTEMREELIPEVELALSQRALAELCKPTTITAIAGADVEAGQLCVWTDDGKVVPFSPEPVFAEAAPF